MGNAKHSIARAATSGVLARTAARWTLATLLIVAGTVGCGGQTGKEERPRLETVDVAPALDVDPTDDPQAVARGPELVGILPKDFPSDLPLLLPASLVDFGASGGLRYVSLLTAASKARVERELVTRIRDRGWTVTDREDGSKRLMKDGQQVRLSIEDARPGTLYHFEY